LLAVVLFGCRSGDRVVVGSKNFSEQVLLGEIIAQAIEKSGVAVDRRLNLGGTFVCDRALRAGEIDVYVEYTGTAYTAILKHPPGPDRQEVLRQVRAAYAAPGLEWLEPLGFENTFAMIVRGDEAQRQALRTISDLAAHPEFRAAFGYEFMERADGFPGLARKYGLAFRERPRVMDLGLLYRALIDRQVDVVAGNSTDGQIASLDLRVLEDDHAYFPPYDAVPVARRATLERHPGLRAVLDSLGGRISADEMRRLNYRVFGVRASAEQVAREFLNPIPGSGATPRPADAPR
jgi:glycine betaine/choline ABC-type transport system substrate-binding protein